MAEKFKVSIRDLPFKKRESYLERIPYYFAFPFLKWDIVALNSLLLFVISFGDGYAEGYAHAHFLGLFFFVRYVEND